MALVGAITASAAPRPAITASRYRFTLAGAGWPWTAFHQVPTQECATTVTGAGHGNAAWE
jgi:hypothetical protein